MNGYKHYKYTAAEDCDLEENIHKQHLDYFKKFYKVVRLCEFDEQHANFMNNQEVLADGL